VIQPISGQIEKSNVKSGEIYDEYDIASKKYLYNKYLLNVFTVGNKAWNWCIGLAYFGRHYA
jgi:hypothetical protein